MSKWLNGIDISHHQSDIDLFKVNFDFCICKATQGKKYVDDYFRFFANTVLAKGAKLGLYHYFDETGSAEIQAEHFVDTIRPYVGKALLALDFEKDMNEVNFNNEFNAVMSCYTFLNRVYELTGVRPLIYMSKSVARMYDWRVISKDFGLWCAQYANNLPVKNFVVCPWTDSKGMGAFKTIAIHQYTSKGILEGYKNYLDLDKAFMSLEAWDKYAEQKKVSHCKTCKCY